MKNLELQDLNPHNYPTTDEQKANLNLLLSAVNQAQSAYGKQFQVTSGLRSDADQQRINPSAPKSKHLLGFAVDILDKDGALATWVKANLDLMAKIGLWMEDFDHTKGWVHFQAIGPKSGKRVFLP